MQASPITITVTVAILASGCCVHAARAQQAPSVAASSSANPIDPLEGKVVREIRINPGLRPSTPDIVRRHLASRQGVPFHQATLAEDRRRLDALRLFSAVEIKPVAAGDEVVLEVDVKETLRLLPLIALSVTDENGVSAGPAFKGINLFGRGTLSSGTAQFGGTTTVSARLERPTVTPGMWALDARAVYRSRRNELFDFDETSTTIEASGGWNWTSRMQVGGRAEFVWFDTGSAEIALSPSGTDHLPAVGLFLTYNSLDPLSNPRVGWFGSVDIARQFGDAQSWTFTVDGRRVQPLSARSTLSLVAFAESQSGVVGRDLPEYYQFGIGGTNSVRGWALGSRIGKNQAIATVEYLYSIVPIRTFTLFGQNLYGGIQAAGFSDVGLAWTDRFSASDAIDGYGVGLRLLVPFVDVVRLDLSFGEPGGGARFGVGIKLKADKQRDRVR
jgi:outer membrane protein assembly factor BamA